MMQRLDSFTRYFFIVLTALSAGALIYVVAQYDRLWRPGLQLRDFNLYASLAFFGLFLAGIFMRSENRIRLLLLLVSTLFTVYLSHGVFYVMTTGGGSPSVQIAQSAGIKYDSRSKSRFIEETRKAGEDISPAATPTFWTGSNGFNVDGEHLFPLGGVSMRTQVMCNESGNWVKFKSDRYGFNNPDEAWNKPAQVMLIGDSWIHGVCVERGEDVAGAFRKSGWNAINLSMTGNGPLIELATLLEYARNRKPRLVLWFYYEENDLPNLKDELNTPVLMRYLREERFQQGLENKQVLLDKAIGQFVSTSRPVATKSERYFDWMVSFLSLGFYTDWLASEDNPLAKNRLLHAGDFEKELALMEEILIKARRETESWGGRFAFVYIPRWARYAQREKDEANLRMEILAVSERAGVPVYDFHKKLSSLPDPLNLFPFRINGHYTPEGNALLAQELKSWLAKNNIYPR